MASLLLQEIYFLQQKPVVSVKSWILYVIEQYLQPFWLIFVLFLINTASSAAPQIFTVLKDGCRD
jgi:hypothetical protein